MRLTTDDPFSLGTQLLDNTPWWVQDNRSGTERSLGFCNPYGVEDDTPVVLGGLRNPDREAYAWQCLNYANGRYRMSCVNGHTGLAMRLCYPHVWMIQRRQAGICPRCVMPPRARELDEKANHIMRDLHNPHIRLEEKRRMMAALEDVQAEMDEMRGRGTITNGAPLTLTEIS